MNKETAFGESLSLIERAYYPLTTQRIYKRIKLRWSDKQGMYRSSKDKMNCPPTWEWTSDWILDKTGDVDQGISNYNIDGWQYSFQFRSSSWTSIPGATTYVRRRKWIRMRTRTINSPEPEMPLPNVISVGRNERELLTLMKDKKVDPKELIDLVELESSKFELATQGIPILLRFYSHRKAAFLSCQKQ